MKNETTEKKIKYIVEIPEPASGQVVSSGGIREKGKIQVQFANPKRYYGPDSSAGLGQNTSNNQTVHDFLVGNVISVAEILVHNFLKEYVLPVVRNRMQMKAIRSIESSRTNIRGKKSECVTNPLVILEKQSPVNMSNNDSVVIPFPNRKIG
ncbi:MAG: hypothetical protein IJI67_06280 [Clostridia bacterium]|nr:hypothetical protein [Clostridia bacterium]